jgi:hypothetical protein
MVPRVVNRWVRVRGRHRELKCLLTADGELWRIADLVVLSDGRVMEAGFGPPLRIFTRCEEDGRIRQPIDRRAVQLGAEERRGYVVELLVEQLERASTWAPPGHNNSTVVSCD